MRTIHRPEVIGAGRWSPGGGGGWGLRVDSEVRPVLVVDLYWIVVHQGLCKASAVSPCVTDIHENDNDNESSSVNNNLQYLTIRL